MSEDKEITAKIDTEELFKKWQEKIDHSKSIKTIIAIGAKTDLGRVRENNEDKYEFFTPEEEDVLASKGSFFAVADGMGGHSAGQIASELALKTVIKSYYNDKSPVINESLRNAVKEANAVIYETSRAIVERNGMGTTLTALVIRGEEIFIAQVGDSRCYRLRDGNIEQITEDHSWVNEQVKRGGMTEEEAMMSPYKNVITRSLGNNPTVEVDIFTDEIEPDDKYLLCSDGLSNLVTPDEIKNEMQKASASFAASNLVDIALDRGGHDNVTVLIVHIKEISTKPVKKKGIASLFGRG
ncbi:MAG: Stp1/IreP family PP2C-type Ser/Thr phosphatase [Armatimonadota bacterium]